MPQTEFFRTAILVKSTDIVDVTKPAVTLSRMYYFHRIFTTSLRGRRGRNSLPPTIIRNCSINACARAHGESRYTFSP